VLIAAHDALKSAADPAADKDIKIPGVDKKIRVAIDLLYSFVKDFPTLNPNIRDARFIRNSEPWSPFKILCTLKKNIRSYQSYVEFPSASLSLNADESSNPR
jgi:hypothetical protein